MASETIIINDLTFTVENDLIPRKSFIPFIIPYILRNKSPYLEKYLSQSWTNRTPIVLNHQYFDITADDINQALEFIWYHHIHKNIEHTIRLDNIVLTAFIIDYFGINAALETLTTYVYQHNNSIDSLLMFIYDRSLCTTSLDEDDLNQLLQ